MNVFSPKGRFMIVDRRRVIQGIGAEDGKKAVDKVTHRLLLEQGGGHVVALQRPSVALLRMSQMPREQERYAPRQSKPP